MLIKKSRLLLMRIALILSGNLYMSPYVQVYLDIMKSEKVEFDVILWDRNGVGEGAFSYNVRSLADKALVAKLYDYFGYVLFVRKTVLVGKYDKLIVFNVALAVILSSFLRRYYCKKYVFDIRDNSVVSSFMRRTFEGVIRCAKVCVISSKGFLSWLPEGYDYQLCHNYYAQADKVFYGLDTDFGKITIANIGSIRDLEANRWLVCMLANDERFVVKFIGDGPAIPKLKHFVAVNKIKNVHFSGKYDKKNESGLLNGVTFINGLTGNDMNSKTLMSNRFYLSVQNRLPILVSKGSFQAQCVDEYGLGLTVNAFDDYKDQILEYINTIDRNQYIKNCERFEVGVTNDQAEFEEKIKVFIEE